MSQRSGLSGCQVAGTILAVLLIAAVCTATGFVVGGGIGLVTGGAAGYAVGRAGPTHIEPRIEIPVPQTPGDEGQRPPEEAPEMGLRPYLGVRYETIEEGARIAHVEPDSPAEAAGLRVRDVILAVDGEPVGEGHPNLTAHILEHEPGDEVELRVQRDAEEVQLEVTLGARFAFR